MSMGIGSIQAANSMAGMQISGARAADSVGKNIESKISDTQKKMQELSAKDEQEISVEEKMKKRQELQQELAKLNAELRQHHEEIDREQRKRLLTEQKQEDSTAKEDDAEDGVIFQGSKAMNAADDSLEQVKSRGIVLARIEDGIAILKGEIKQDEARGENVEKKQQELEKQEEKARKAAESQFSALGKAAQTMADAVQTDKTEKADAQKKAIISSTNYSKERNQETQQFYASIDIQNQILR